MIELVLFADGALFFEAGEHLTDSPDGVSNPLKNLTPAYEDHKQEEGYDAVYAAVVKSEI